MRGNQHRGQMVSGAAMLAAAIIFCAFIASFAALSAEAAKLPPYRASGPIPGTSLLYEKLSISDRGAVRITIANPTNTGVAFTANFGFYNDKGRYLTGFTVEGFAAANRKDAYSLTLDNHRAFRNATTMRVLGRSGRMGRDPDFGE